MPKTHLYPKISVRVNLGRKHKVLPGLRSYCSSPAPADAQQHQSPPTPPLPLTCKELSPQLHSCIKSWREHERAVFKTLKMYSKPGCNEL